MLITPICVLPLLSAVPQPPTTFTYDDVKKEVTYESVIYKVESSDNVNALLTFGVQKIKLPKTDLSSTDKLFFFTINTEHFLFSNTNAKFYSFTNVSTNTSITKLPLLITIQNQDYLIYEYSNTFYLSTEEVANAGGGTIGSDITNLQSNDLANKIVHISIPEKDVFIDLSTSQKTLTFKKYKTIELSGVKLLMETNPLENNKIYNFDLTESDYTQDDGYYKKDDTVKNIYTGGLLSDTNKSLISTTPITKLIIDSFFLLGATVNGELGLYNADFTKDKDYKPTTL